MKAAQDTGGARWFHMCKGELRLSKEKGTLFPFKVNAGREEHEVAEIYSLGSLRKNSLAVAHNHRLYLRGAGG